MIVCHCNRVNDRTIRASVRAGACTPEDVAECCGAGASCGGCAPAVEEILGEERLQLRRLPVVSYASEPAALAAG